MAPLALAPGASLPGTYDPQLVVLSVVIASIAAYAALTLAERVTVAAGRARLLWLLGGATAMGSGIWSMHFIGMLAFKLPLPITYDVPLVVLSLLAAVVASGIALTIASRRDLPPHLLLLGGLTLGAGVVAMHYIGMAAMRMDAMARWDVPVVALSVVIAVVASLVAIWLAFHLRAVRARHGEWRRAAAAGVMGAAIAGMHYTGMAAAQFAYMAMPASEEHGVSAAVLGNGAITFIALVVLSLALGVAFIDRRFAAQEKSLSESKQHVRMVVANAPVILFALDPAGMITLAQGRGLTALGRSPERHRRPIRSSSCSRRCRSWWSKAAAPSPGGAHRPSSLGTVVLEVRWVPARDDLGEVHGAIAVATDITERTRVEQALARRRRRLRRPTPSLIGRAGSSRSSWQP